MSASFKERKPIIGIPIGDVNGIGTEVIIKSLSDKRIINQATPIIYGEERVLSFYKKRLNFHHFNFFSIQDTNQAQQKKINVLNCWQEGFEITPGKMNKTGGEYAFKALESATNDWLAGKIDALVTAPINKHNIQSNDFNFHGHTDYLIQKTKMKEGLMFMISENIKVGVITEHIPLKDVPSKIDKKLVESKVNLMLKSLKQDFGILKPSIAVLGLNPHAGEGGLVGKEENEIIKPVLDEIKSKGHLVMGPFPADGFFGSGQYTKYDGILAMYHDQGLVPFKSLTFSMGVNYTAGLPFIRTSPDHGTAYHLAGKNQANHGSMLMAIFAALDIIQKRKKLF